MALINCKECGKEISDQADKCPHCGFPVKTALPNKEKPKQKGISFRGFLAIVIGIILVGYWLAGSCSDGTKPDGGTQKTQSVTKPTPKPAPRSIDLEASIRFTGTQFMVTNQDNFDWFDCKLDLNGGLFSDGYVIRVPIIPTQDTFTVGAMQFAKGDGTRFNPLTMKPQNLFVTCDLADGRYGIYSGSWK